MARAELLAGDLRRAVQQLKQVPGHNLLACGVMLPLFLAGFGLIDEYEFIVHSRVAGHGPTLLAGLPQHLDLQLIGQKEFASGAIALRYEPGR